MTIASILVAVDLEPSARERLRLAGALADAFGAGLIGVAADEPPYGVPPVGPTLGSTYALAAASEMVMNDLTRAHAVFEAEIGRDRRRAWRSNLGPTLPFLIAQAAAADLVVVGRGEAPTLFAIDPGDLAMQLGGPVLVVPPGIDHLDAKRVLVGWKNTREARRAVRDAMPFLEKASQVVVASVDDGFGSADPRDLVALLRAHGIATRAVTPDATGTTVAEALTEAAAEYGVDLVVAGAYGHSRLREWAFGGVTRDLMAGSPVCCLMSH
ncbi:universal stress protein [Methylobacterium nonmethylotrophicum]|uniref:Universal stress protein n=1 Tax=Methylobacterium nonmethylotrophicum TaxID=1141884 RepID=A0A4Z0NMQ0_9HYPH|nr:universal stress protein [Methylobacterium nonmethylotrophicum]TGD97687.1 universal stress protein [Methylobacterium nonmethylotrophicum]